MSRLRSAVLCRSIRLAEANLLLGIEWISAIEDRTRLESLVRKMAAAVRNWQNPMVEAIQLDGVDSKERRLSKGEMSEGAIRMP